MVHLILVLAIIFSFSRVKHIRLIGGSFILLSLFAIFRYNYGNDYNSYMKSYEIIKDGGVVFDNEILYTLLNKITPSFYLLIAITSLFFLFVIYRLVNKQLLGLYQGLAVVIFLINPYLFLLNLSSIRQCIAMCIFIIASKYLQERNFFKYVLLIILASAFHLSAFVLILLYFFVNDKEMNKLQTVLLVGGMVFLLIEGTVITRLIETGLSVFDNTDYLYHYSQGNTNSLRATLLTGVYFVYVAINLVHLKGYKLICGKLYLIGLFIGMLAIHFAMITRIQMYFDIFSIITIPSIIEYHINNPGKRWLRIINICVFPALILTIYAARYYSFFSNPLWETFFNYHTIFEAIL